MMNEVRKHSATAQFDVIRLMISMTTLLPYRLGIVDISGAYIKSGPIKWKVYVRPPKEWNGTKTGNIWELLKLSYGITEAGRQWATVLEGWLTEGMGIERINGVSQLFLRRDETGEIVFIVENITDDVLFSGTVQTMEEFIRAIKERFDVRKVITDGVINFN